MVAYPILYNLPFDTCDTAHLTFYVSCPILPTISVSVSVPDARMQARARMRAHAWVSTQIVQTQSIVRPTWNLLLRAVLYSVGSWMPSPYITLLFSVTMGCNDMMVLYYCVARCSAALTLYCATVSSFCIVHTAHSCLYTCYWCNPYSTAHGVQCDIETGEDRLRRPRADMERLQDSSAPSSSTLFARIRVVALSLHLLAGAGTANLLGRQQHPRITHRLPTCNLLSIIWYDNTLEYDYDALSQNSENAIVDMINRTLK